MNSFLKPKLVIVTSVIDPVLSNLRSSNRSLFKKEKRFEQTKVTLGSLSAIKNKKILFIEATDIDEYMEEYILDHVDYYVNTKNVDWVTGGVNSPWKCIGEARMIEHGLKFHSLTEYNSVFKISGRYYISKDFQAERQNVQNSVFSHQNKGAHWNSTFFYKICEEHFEVYQQCLAHCSNARGVMERRFFNFFRDTDCMYVPKFGVCGWAGPTGGFYCW